MVEKKISVFSYFHDNTVKKKRKKPVIQYYSQDNLKSLTYYELLEKVVFLNKALVDKGINPNDRVGIVSENRIEWIISDLATNSIGIVNVPIFPNFTADQQKYIFSDSGAKAVIVSNKLQLKNILSIKDELPDLKFIVVMSDELEDESNNIFSFNKLIDNVRKENYDKLKNDFLKKSQSVNQEDIFTIIYTSGTTGNPKGVVLTNKNILSNIKSIIATNIIKEEDSFLSFLPLCHAYERTVIYTLLTEGGLITIAQSIDTLSKNINEISPTIITAVPKMLETVRSKILKGIQSEKTAKRHIALSALKLSDKYVGVEKIPFLDRIKLKIYDKIVFSKLRARLGGNLNYIVSGGAALPIEVQKFFISIGITVIQGYGLTECSPVVSANLPSNLELGTVGPPLESVEVKFSESGEVLVRGDLVMKGYWNDEVATRSCIDDNNWFHTGDIGKFTESGSLKITGRIKNIIITNGGKNISPSPIENLLRMSDYIEFIAIYGNDRDYLTAVISPDYEQLKNLAEVNSIKFTNINELVNDSKIIKIIKKDIDKRQSTLAKYERVRKFHIVEKPFTIETGELTPKMSMKTNVIFEKYKSAIEEMYK